MLSAYFLISCSSRAIDSGVAPLLLNSGRTVNFLVVVVAFGEQRYVFSACRAFLAPVAIVTRASRVFLSSFPGKGGAF